MEYRGTFLPIEGGDPGRQPGETVPLLDAQQRLKADDTVFAGFLHGLLLGYWTKDDGVSRAGLEDFERYGTQWRPELRRGIPFQAIPFGREDNQLPDSQMMLRIAPSGADLLNEAKNDVGWIAQLYLRVNPFFWPTPGAYSPALELPLKLAGPGNVPGTELPTRLYPGPDGSLAMVMVIGLPAPSEHVFRRVYSIVSPILDELSVRFDHPLPLSQFVVIGIPSGVATVVCSKPSTEAILRDGDYVNARYEFQQLSVALALYREAASSNSPFHKLLTFWRAWENALKVRADHRKTPAGKLRTPNLEVFPRLAAFGEFQGLDFSTARKRLNESYRVALAHGQLKRGGLPKSGASVDDFAAVLDMVPIVRYMARITIGNTREILRTAASVRPK